MSLLDIMIDMNFVMSGEIERVVKNMFFQRKFFIKDEKPMRFIPCCFNTVDRKQGVSKLNVSKLQETYPYPPSPGESQNTYVIGVCGMGIH